MSERDDGGCYHPQGDLIYGGISCRDKLIHDLVVAIVPHSLKDFDVIVKDAIKIADTTIKACKESR